MYRTNKPKKISRPDVSVIMPCYNSQQYMEEAIESILNQTYINFELILVDDGSDDKTWEIMMRYQKRDPRVKVVKNKNIKGQAGSMNTGFDISIGRKYIARMDSDDISLPKRLEKQVLFLEKNKEYGLCSVNMSAMGEVELPFLFEKQDVPLEWMFFWKNPIAGPATMYRANVLRDNKIRFKEYKVASDYDFFSRVLLYAKPKMLYEEILYKYRIHKKSVFQKNKKEAISNSIKMNHNFIKSVVNKEIPDFHSQLIEFKLENSENKELKIFEVVEWMIDLLKSAKKQWRWNEEEYDKAVRYSDNLIKKVIIEEEKKDLGNNWINNEEELSKLRQEILNKDLDIQKLKKNDEDLKNQIKGLEEEVLSYKESKSWKVTSPLRWVMGLMKNRSK